MEPIRKQIFIFYLNKSFGFFSTFFFLCKAYIYCKENNIDFYIEHLDWAYDGGNGWHYYFDSLSLFNGDKKIHNIITGSQGSPNIWHHFPKYKIKDYITCINEIFMLKEMHYNEAINYINNVICDEYISIYVRRGDKCAENKFINENTIINTIKPKINDKIFIQTDDYTVIENIQKLLPDNKIFYLIKNTKRGHYQSAGYINMKNDQNIYKSQIIPFNNINNKDLIREDTLELLTGIVILTKAKNCWVDNRSNVGRFIKLYSPMNTYSYDNVSFKFDVEKQCDPYLNL